MIGAGLKGRKRATEAGSKGYIWLSDLSAGSIDRAA